MERMNVRELMQVLLHKLWFLLLCGALGAGIGFAVAYYLITPQYTASMTMYVAAGTDALDDYYVGDLSLSQRLLDSCMVIIQSRSVMTEVANKCHLGYTAEDVRSMIQILPTEGTEFFEVSVTNSDPQNARAIADAFAAVAPEEMLNIYADGTIKILDGAVTPASPSFPDKGQFTILGFLCGCVLACIIVLLKRQFQGFRKESKLKETSQKKRENEN